MQSENVTDDVIERVEEIVGMGTGAWYMVDPKEIIAASVTALAPKVTCPSCGGVFVKPL